MPTRDESRRDCLEEMPRHGGLARPRLQVPAPTTEITPALPFAVTTIDPLLSPSMTALRMLGTALFTVTADSSKPAQRVAGGVIARAGGSKGPTFALGVVPLAGIGPDPELPLGADRVSCWSEVVACQKWASIPAFELFDASKVQCERV
jgi:hypothetical protein